MGEIASIPSKMSLIEYNKDGYAARYRMEPKDLTSVLKGATPGEWLALSMDRTTILGRGETAQGAKRAAVEAGHSQVVLFCVPLPSMGIAATTDI
jgi:hypothetical protein